MTRADFQVARRAYRLACWQDACETQARDEDARDPMRDRWATGIRWPVMARQQAALAAMVPKLSEAVRSAHRFTDARGRRPDDALDPRSQHLQAHVRHAALQFHRRAAVRDAVSRIDAFDYTPRVAAPLTPAPDMDRSDSPAASGAGLLSSVCVPPQALASVPVGKESAGTVFSSNLENAA